MFLATPFTCSFFSMRSMTVHQLKSMNSTTDTITLVGTLRFVGDTTSWLFDFVDTTGTLRVYRPCVTTRVVDDIEERIKEEMHPHVDDIGLPPWKNGDYHRVVGVMTDNGFEATHIRPVNDMNEFTMHMLEAIYQHCQQ